MKQFPFIASYDGYAKIAAIRPSSERGARRAGETEPSATYRALYVRHYG